MAESIFGIDVAVREVDVNEEFTPTFARLPDIVDEMYSSLAGDDTNLNKQMTRGMLMYYATAMLWARLLDIKAKRGNANLTFNELEFCKALNLSDFNIPQPLYLFLKGIGEVKDQTGKTVRLADHTLPVTVVQGFGGYHSQVINAATHNLYEEIPSLGICGDILMAEAADAANPAVNFRVVPANTTPTQQLVGYFGPIGVRKEEVKIVLQTVGITDAAFNETVITTRLNLNLVQKVSDYLCGSPTFRNEKVMIDALTAEGDAAQLIQTVPTEENIQPAMKWINLIVRPTSANASPITVFGASYLMGYQLSKMTIADSNANWCCLVPAPVVPPAVPWVIPADWIVNRNERRALPPGMNVGEGRGKPLYAGGAEPVIVENLGGGLCPAVDVFRLK